MNIYYFKCVKKKGFWNSFFFPPDKFMKQYSGLAESAKNIVMRPITVQTKKESNKGNSGGKLWTKRDNLYKIQ